MWILKVTRPIGILFAMLTLSIVQLNPIHAAQTPSPTQTVFPVRLCSIAFSPDGKIIISSTDDGHVRLWDMQTSVMLHDFTMDKGCIYAAFTADSQRLFTSWPGSDMVGKDALTILWDVQTGKEIRLFEGKNMISEDGQLILTVSDLPQKLWNATTGDLIRIFNQNLHAIPGVVFSPDNQKLISHNFPIEQAELWDIKTGKRLFTFPQQNAGWISVVQFLPDSEYALVGNDNNDVALWNLNTLKIEQGFKDSVGAATFHIFSDNGKFFMVTDDYDGRIRVWDVQTGEVQTSFMTHIPYEYGSDSAVSSDGKLMLLGFRKGISQLWNLETGSLIREYAPPVLPSDLSLDDTYTLVKFSPDNEQALIGYSNEAMHLWDLKTGTERVYDMISP